MIETFTRPLNEEERSILNKTLCQARPPLMTMEAWGMMVVGGVAIMTGYALMTWERALGVCVAWIGLICIIVNAAKGIQARRRGRRDRKLAESILASNQVSVCRYHIQSVAVVHCPDYDDCWILRQLEDGRTLISSEDYECLPESDELGKSILEEAATPWTFRQDFRGVAPVVMRKVPLACLNRQAWEALYEADPVVSKGLKECLDELIAQPVGGEQPATLG